MVGRQLDVIPPQEFREPRGSEWHDHGSFVARNIDGALRWELTPQFAVLDQTSEGSNDFAGVIVGLIPLGI
jgi:hypothetical protein